LDLPSTIDGVSTTGLKNLSIILGEVWLTEAYQFALGTLHLAFEGWSNTRLILFLHWLRHWGGDKGVGAKIDVQP
jgi:hypothetical protein